MKLRLGAAEAGLTAIYSLSGFTGTITEWAGLRQNHGAAHPGGQHTTGDAIDVNYESNPYIVVRTPTSGGVVYGGEAPSTPAPPASALRMARLRATVVFDRAVAFLTSSSSVASIGARAPGESTTSVFQRFGVASNALSRYLQLVFKPTVPAALNPPPRLVRTPVANAFSASKATLLAGIPAAERWPETVAAAHISAALADPAFAANHPGWSTEVEFWYTQILRDYEIARIPMQFGPASLAPTSTRNPANGFLDLRHELVLALASDPPLPVMRWGVCDFGSAESGDVMHFDLAPRLPSGSVGPIPPDARIDVNTTAGIQQALGSLGFDAGAVNGVPGPQTATAINAFRASRTPPMPVGGIDQHLRDEVLVALTNAAIPS
ncbi:peptidoglycan-binding domain-containing protein [Streptomyces cellulosae]